MHTAIQVLIVLTAGLASQWLAWRLRLPAIVILIASGLLLGPLAGVIRLDLPPAELAELIGLGVAIILFEGGMDLKFGEFRRVGHGVGRLTLLAPPIAWLLGTLAAHYLAGLSWPVASVLGAILVVTGPTVILPVLRQARLNKESASLLKWEGIVNDPVGVLIAVLAFQYFTTVGEGLEQTLISLGAAIAAALVLGGGGGRLIGWVYQRGLVPEHLKPPILMVLVLVVYWASNLVQHEAGLLSVTVMGVVIGNVKLIEREELQRFKENLTVILVSVLFVVLPSGLSWSHLEQIDWRSLLFVLAVLVVVRPLTILLATVAAPVRKADRLLLAWIAPRGIVAAATAGVFGPALVASGHPDAEKLLPIVFMVIVATVLAHGLTIGQLARRLGLAAEAEKGLFIVGASPWACALAQALKKLGIKVLVADGAYQALRSARMQGIDVYYGEILSEHAEHALDVQHLSHLLCATDNDFYNALVCKAKGRHFGRHRTFQIATHEESGAESRRLTLQQRGHLAFAAKADFEYLQGRLDAGWTIQTTTLSPSYGLDQMKQRLGEPGRDWLLLGGLTSDGVFELCSSDRPCGPTPGWTVLFYAPEVSSQPKRIEAGSEAEARSRPGAEGVGRGGGSQSKLNV